jgi:hypothetical protein
MVFRPRIGLNLDRERHDGHKRILRDYFNLTPMYDERLFRQCYMMNKNLFLKIMYTFAKNDSYIVQRRKIASLLGLLNIQKCTTTLGMYVYKMAINTIDECYMLGKSMEMETMKWFIVKV